MFNYIGSGFINEFKKTALLANMAVSSLRRIGKIAPNALRSNIAKGIRKLRNSKSYESAPKRSAWKETVRNPFGESKNWKDLKGYQKARVVAGIGGNVAMVAPFVAMGKKNENPVSN